MSLGERGGVSSRVARDDDDELNRKYQIIETFLSERGIRISEKEQEEVPHQKYLQDYHRRSSRMILDA